MAHTGVLSQLVPLQDEVELYPYIAVLLLNIGLHPPALRVMTAHESIRVLLKMCYQSDDMTVQVSLCFYPCACNYGAYCWA